MGYNRISSCSLREGFTIHLSFNPLHWPSDCTVQRCCRKACTDNFGHYSNGRSPEVEIHCLIPDNSEIGAKFINMVESRWWNTAHSYVMIVSLELDCGPDFSMSQRSLGRLQRLRDDEGLPVHKYKP